MLLAHLTYLDVWPLCHSLYARRNKLGKPNAGVRRLPLTEGDWKAPELKDWVILKNLLTRCDRLLRKRSAEWEIVGADLECLEPGASLPWEPGADGEIQGHVGIVTNPVARLLAGPEHYCVGWGEVVLSAPNSRVKRSATNFGDTPRTHLVLKLRQTSNLLQSHELEAEEAET